MKLKVLKSKWTLLMILQVVLLAVLASWAWSTIRLAQQAAEEFAVPPRCPEGHDSIVVVDIAYGVIARADEVEEMDALDLQTKGGDFSGPASPAFVFRCTECGWQTDGWSIETVIKMKGRGELPDLPGMTR